MTDLPVPAPGSGPRRRPLDPQMDRGMDPGPKRSVAQMFIGGRATPLTGSPRCRTCQSPYRAEIERALLGSISKSSVLASLPEGHGLNENMIGNHYRHHLPARETVHLALVNDRAREIGINLETHAGSLVDYRSFLKVGLQRTFERLADGEIMPDVKDGIAFAKAIAEIDIAMGGDIDQTAMAQGMLALIASFQGAIAEFAPEYAYAISNSARRRAEANPIVRSLLNLQDDGESQEQFALDEGDREPQVFIEVAFDSAPAMDSASAIIFPNEHNFESAPVADSAHAVLTKAEDIPVIDTRGME